MKFFLCLFVVLLTGCSTASGPYVPPKAGDIAYLNIDNREIASTSRNVRIVGMTTSGCISDPMVTTDLFATQKNVYRIAIPAGEKIVLHYEESVDISRGSYGWYNSFAFTPEAGIEYQLHSYFKLRAYEFVKENKVPEPLKKAVNDHIKSDPEGMGEASMTALTASNPNTKEIWWVDRESTEQPKEKTIGYCLRPATK